MSKNNYSNTNDSNDDFSKYKENQLIRFDGKNTFIEVMTSSMNINKLLINFVKYDNTKEKNNRTTAKISIYLDIPKAKLLCHNILSGRIPAIIENQRKKDANKITTAWELLGGTSVSRLRQQGKEREDGNAVSRIFRIQGPGRVAPFMFTAEEGPGQENDTGLIVPIYKKTEKKLVVPLTSDNLKEFALMVDMFINSYYSAKETVKAFEAKRKAKTEANNFANNR